MVSAANVQIARKRKVCADSDSVHRDLVRGIYHSSIVDVFAIPCTSTNALRVSSRRYVDAYKSANVMARLGIFCR